MVLLDLGEKKGEVLKVKLQCDTFVPQRQEITRSGVGLNTYIVARAWV